MLGALLLNLDASSSTTCDETWANAGVAQAGCAVAGRGRSHVPSHRGRHHEESGYSDEALIRKVIQHHEDLSALRDAQQQIPAAKSPAAPEIEALQPQERVESEAPALEPRVVFVPITLEGRVVTVRAPGKTEITSAPTDRVMTEEELLMWILLADE